MKHKLILPKIVFILVLMVLMSAFPVLASSSDEIPYESYTYWENYSGTEKKAVYSKPMYQPDFIIDAECFSVKSFTTLADVCSDDNGNVYILDGGASVIYVLDKDYNHIKTVSSVLKDGEKLSFTGAKGIFVSGKEIYISDTENARVLKIDYNGKFIDEFLVPDSNLIPDGFEYRPIKTAIDSRGYLYILCDGSYYGAILYSPENEFLGFYGANTTKGGILQAVEIIFNKLFMTNTKLSQSESKLPFQITDLYMDSENFVYTCTGRTEVQETQSGQIRRFSPGGIMTKDTSTINFADISLGTVKGEKLSQDLLGISLDDDNYIYALDSAYGRIFLYDKDYKLLSAFGAGLGRGEQLGTFALPCAIETNGDDVLVCDSANNNVTVFKITDYGKLVKTARKMTIDGDYEESKALWQEVLSLDKNSQLAYNGLAKALYVEGEYKQAMEYAKLGIDKETYGQAFKWVRREYIKDNFIWIFLIAVVALGALCAALVYLTKHKVTLLSNPKVNVMFSSVAHPFDSFTKVKYNNLGSLPLSFIILIVFYITTIIKTTKGGYLYSSHNPAEFNSLYIIIRTFGLVILWAVSNWAVCALRGGIGKLKEIFIVTCYSLIPIIFGNIIYVILTNIMLPTEAGFLSVLMNAFTIYAAFMLIIGIMKVHDYEFGKFITTTIMTIVGMAIILCLIVLIIILVQQLGAFAITIIMEIAYR